MMKSNDNEEEQRSEEEKVCYQPQIISNTALEYDKHLSPFNTERHQQERASIS